MSNNPHLHLVGYDPKGTDNRRWQCTACKAIGPMGELMKGECSVPTKPGDQQAALLKAISGPKS